MMKNAHTFKRKGLPQAKPQAKWGFTLIEVIVYVALVAIFVTGFIFFTWDIVYGRERARAQESVNQSVRIALARIGYELRRAEDLVSTSPTEVVVENPDGTNTTVRQTGTTLELLPSGLGPYSLTSNQVEVLNFSISDLSPANASSQNITINLELQEAYEPLSGERAHASHTVSVEFNGQFNLARQLVVDWSDAVFTGSFSVERSKIRNAGDTDVLITHIIPTWTSGLGNLTGFQIAGGPPECCNVGESFSSGDTVDIEDFLLTISSGQNPINYIQFDTDIVGNVLNVGFKLSDGSVARGSILLTRGGSGGGAGSCLQTCVNLDIYNDGVCRRSPSQCTSSGQENEPSGDQFCTSPPNDTCCCTPI